MKERIIVSDFDGTITTKDSLYYFFENYATEEWLEVERLWVNRTIGSKECLTREFNLVVNLSEELIEKYIKTIKLDEYFFEFIREIEKLNIDFAIVSDGIDYFINKILKNHNIENIKIIANHSEFKNNSLEITCPHSFSGCKVNSGTCKCKVINDFKNEYKELIYIGDGTSDFCAANNAKIDKLYAKAGLLKYCKSNNIRHIEFNTFKEILDSII